MNPTSFHEDGAPIFTNENDIKEYREKKLIDKRFYSEKLLNNIFLKLNNNHQLDDKEKIALFIIRLTAELNPNDRCSAALKGDSSAGKDNIIRSVLELFPEDDNFFLTRGTAAAIEDEVSKVKCIAFSEINKHRENGANSDITETFKALAEGGISIIKKDPASGYRTTLKIKSEQKTLFYGTTETQSDDELETRYIVIPIRGYSAKNKIVVDSVLKNVSQIPTKKESDDNWIMQGIELLNRDLDIIIPFAEELTKKIKDKGKEIYFFDYTKERIKRDAKRLLSVTKAITWLHQKQRRIIEEDGQKYLLAEPSDFITAIEIFADFFNLTYSGLDHRVEKCLNTILKLQGTEDNRIMKDGYEPKYYGYAYRDSIQKDLGISSLNTIKKRISKLKDLGYIEGTHWDEQKGVGYLIKAKKGGVMGGVNPLSIPVTVTALDTHLTPYLIPPLKIEKYGKKKIKPLNIDFLKINDNLSVSNIKNDTPQIDTHQISTVHTSKNKILALISNSKKGIYFDDLKIKFSDLSENEMKEQIDLLKNKGDIFEPKVGLYMI